MFSGGFDPYAARASDRKGKSSSPAATLERHKTKRRQLPWIAHEDRFETIQGREGTWS